MPGNATIVPQFVSAKADGADATLVRPSDWNATRKAVGGADQECLVFDATPASKMGWRAIGQLMAHLLQRESDTPIVSYVVLTGTVSTTATSPVVSGVGTAFDTELKIGDRVRVGTATLEWFIVKTVDSATQFTATTNVVNAQSGVTARRLDMVRGGGIPVGSVTDWFQATAPVGWTQVVTQNDKAMRVVSGVGGGVGGATAFSAAWPAHAHTVNPHVHTVPRDGWGGVGSGLAGRIVTGDASAADAALPRANNDPTSGSSSPGTSSLAAIQPQFINVILASKD